MNPSVDARISGRIGWLVIEIGNRNSTQSGHDSHTARREGRRTTQRHLSLAYVMVDSGTCGKSPNLSRRLPPEADRSSVYREECFDICEMAVRNREQELKGSPSELLLLRIPQISRAIRSDQPIQRRRIFSTLGLLSFQRVRKRGRVCRCSCLRALTGINFHEPRCSTEILIT
jgi:hypothetical protein